MGLVNSVLRRFGLQDDDDAKSVGMMAIVKAARAYDPSRGWRFSTYATTAIRFEIGHYLKHRKPCEWPADSPTDTPDPRDPAFQVADAEQASMIWSAVNRLPRRQRRLILSVYRDGLAIREAGHRIGLNGTSRRVHHDALARLACLLRHPT